MSNHDKGGSSGVIRFLFDNSLFLIGGALLALIWANVDVDSYHSVVHLDLKKMVLGQTADGGGEHATGSQ